MISRATEFRLALAAFGLLAVIFIAFPGLDLAASSLFHRNGTWLFERDSPWLALPYQGIPLLGQALLIGLFALWLGSCLPCWPALRARRALLGFWVAAALAGPVLLVNKGIKEYSGRTRPVNITQFGGEKQFTPAFIPAKECAKNCAFVSGHTATAAFIMAFGWLSAPARRRRWLIASLAAAGVVGLTRMLPGGHFLSDVIFAWFAVYFSLWAIEWAFRFQKPPGKEAPRFPRRP